MSILFSIFSCNEENKVIHIQSIKCNSSLHILYKFSSTLTLLIYLPSVILLNYCYINFIKIKEKKFTKRTTEPDVYMFLLNVYFTSFHCLFDNKFKITLVKAKIETLVRVNFIIFSSDIGL